MTTIINKNNSDNTKSNSLLGKISCIMGNVDNIGFVRQKIGRDESLTNWTFNQLDIHKIDPMMMKYSNQIGAQEQNKIKLAP